MGIDTWEVIRAASTKPYAFMAHYPSLGVGGPCIPLNPFYLHYKAKLAGVDTRFILLAGEITRSMPFHVVTLIRDALNLRGKNLRGSRILVLGATYKKNIPDIRESPSKTLVGELLKSGAKVAIYDPFVKETFGAQSTDNLEGAIRGNDCIVLAVDHDKFKDQNIESLIVKLNPNVCVVDTKNFFNSSLLKKVYYKCLGKG